MNLQSGLQIDKYVIKHRLGAGGMADVFLATDTSLGRDVALKVLPPEFARDPERVSRFEKEVRASAALSHPNIVQVFDVGEFRYEAVTLKYYTMALLSGGDLKDRIRSGLGQPESLRVLKQVASGLAHAHSRGFVHRDIKPENILFDSAGNAVLTDLGIAKAIGSGTKMTKTGMSIGTPHYMSPEQARGDGVDGRSDLYALGIVFYEMLTGAVPFDRDDTIAIALAHINAPVPALPADFAALQPMLERLLAKQPEVRYADGDALLADIEKLKAGEMLKAFQPTRQVASVTVGSEGDTGSGKTAQSAGNGLKWALGGAALAAVLGVGAMQIGMFDSAPAQRPSAGGAAVSSPAQPITPVVGEAELARQRLQDLTIQQEVEQLISAARADIAANRLTSPENNNAFAKVQQMLDLSPGHPAEQELLAEIVGAYRTLAQSATQAGQFDQARRHLQSANAIVPGFAGYERLVAEVDSAQAEAQRRAQAQARAEAEAERQRQAQARQAAQSVGEMITIPAGSFRMGSASGGHNDERPVRTLNLRSFRLGKHEVTFAQWDACVTDGGCSHRPGDEGWGRGNRPVINVSYNDITQQFIPWLNRRTGQTFRLPTEAEWEYAARAGTTTNYPWGDTASRDYANYGTGNGGATGGRDQWTNTAPVGSFPANRFGLHDMHGNVREWVQDCWNGRYNGAPTNGSAWMQGDCSRAVLRGGSWSHHPGGVRSAYRNRDGRADRLSISGFRLAQDI